MLGIIGIIALLSILGLSLIITRLATLALSYTGLSQEAARFQARSAFTGTGFTTNEAEYVVDHPVRRRIIMIIMLLRSAGFITILLSLILSFADEQGIDRLHRLLWLVSGVMVLWLISLSRAVDQIMKRVMHWALKRWTNLEARDYVELLKLTGDFVIREVHIESGDWLADRRLADCQLLEEGVTILGIYRHNGNYVGVPKVDTEIHPGDTLVLYGRAEAIQKLDRRRSGGEGDREHEESMDEQQRYFKRQDEQEEAEA